MKSIITAIVILSFFLCLKDVFAADYRLYTGVGGMHVKEQVPEGHKSFHLVGGQMIFEDIRYKLDFGLEGFIMGEAAEEDPEIPCSGGGVFVNYRYKNEGGWFQPYLGVRYDHFSRGTAPKYEDPNDSEYDQYGPNGQLESEHDLVCARGGARLQLNKYLYAEGGTIIPLYSSTKSGNFGWEWSTGIEYKGFDIAYKFKQIRLTDHHFSGPTALMFYFSGIELGYRW